MTEAQLLRCLFVSQADGEVRAFPQHAAAPVLTESRRDEAAWEQLRRAESALPADPHALYHTVRWDPLSAFQPGARAALLRLYREREATIALLVRCFWILRTAYFPPGRIDGDSCYAL